MTTLWWVRHGPTHQKAFTGWRDVPADLSDTAKIARLNAYLPDTAVLVSSDLIRASASADCLASATRQRLADNPDLREFNFGDWDGKNFAQVAKTHGDLSREYWENPGDVAPPNGESWNVAAARITGAVERLISEHPGSDIIIVAHMGTILTRLQRAGPMPAKEAISHVVEPLSVTRQHLQGGVWRNCEINHIL